MPAASAFLSRPLQRFPLLRYALLGPPIGTAVFVLFLTLLGAREVLAKGTESLSGWLFQFIAFGWPIFLLFGYAFGLLPALATGALAQWLAARRASALHLPAIVLAALALCFGWSRFIGQDTGTALQMAACGGIGAAVCAFSGRRGGVV
jgi:hypothetical protein